MAPKAIIFGAIALASAYFWQVFLHDFVFYTLGVGREYNRIEDYPYSCKQIRHPLLESCEDLALDEETRTLYAACSTSLGRKGWSPGGDKFNVSSRSLKDHVTAINIDIPGEDGLYGLKELEITGSYRGSGGGKVIDVHGFKIEPLSTGGLRFWMVNHRPPIDEAGIPLDATKSGANSTIEAFDLVEGSSRLEHVSTFHEDAILTPNGVAPTGDGGFLFTNDHHDSVAPSFLRQFHFLFGPGSIGSCIKGKCQIAYPKGDFPNGIVKSKDGLYYVSHATAARVIVFALQEDGTLLKVDEILVGMGIDNLSVDSEGNIFGAAFPDPFGLLKSLEDPVNVSCGSTVFRIRRLVSADGKPEHEVTKVLEDIEAKVLPCSTSAVHDAKTGNIYLGSVTSPFITICEKNK